MVSRIPGYSAAAPTPPKQPEPTEETPSSICADWVEILIESAFHRYREGTDDLETAIKTLSELAGMPRADTPLVQVIGGKIKNDSLYG